MSFAVDKQVITSPFIQSLGGADSELGKQYMYRIKQRRTLYVQGLSIGLLLSLGYIYASPLGKQSSIHSACIVASITFLTLYFYYMLSPKLPLMVLQLNTDEQRTHWASIYKTMQWNYHLGLLLGVLGVAIGGYTLC